MIYLICQDYINTTNNHAGIKYLCKEIEARNPSLFKTYVMPYFLDQTKVSKYKLICYIEYKIADLRHKKYVQKFSKEFLGQISAADVVIIMEYMDMSYMFYSLVKEIKQKDKNTRIFGMVHLVPQKLEKAFPNKLFLDWALSVDKIITLGTSLTNYFIEKGVPKQRVHTTFHYVDSYYSRVDDDVCDIERLKVIAMGNQMRNIELLHRIVNDNPQVDFIICQGVNHFEYLFEKTSNVKLIPFVPENELREYMSESDVSLNVMDDTIGSNVIVTSMAMGLTMICSDVGSIRDYCDESNCVFCNNDDKDSFSKAIDLLSRNKTLCKKMKGESVRLSKRLTIDNFIKDILSLTKIN